MQTDEQTTEAVIVQLQRKLDEQAAKLAEMTADRDKWRTAYNREIEWKHKAQAEGSAYLEVIEKLIEALKG